MRIRNILAMIVVFVLLQSCAAAATPETTTKRVVDSGGAPASQVGPEIHKVIQAEGVTNQATANQPAAVASTSGIPEKRIVIKNANLSIVVVDPGQAMNNIAKMAEDMGGFVVTSNLYKVRTKNGNEIPAAKITVRVPADKLNDALAKIKGLVRDPEQQVLSEDVSGQDVTKEYTDLQSRLKNKQMEADRLREILQEASKTEDILAVSNQLSAVEEEVEVLKGQIKYYDEAAALSAISVDLQSEEAVAPLEIGGWKPVGVARDALQTLIDTLQFLSYAAIWIVIFCLPLSILGGIPLFFIIRGIRHWRKGRKVRAAQQSSTEPPSDQA